MVALIRNLEFLLIQKINKIGFQFKTRENISL